MADVIPENTISVLDHGFVRLDDSMASDLSVANAARVSFAKRKDVMDEADEGLIRFLMRDRHGTPFEHNSFRFHIRCPIFVAREWMRHRVGSFNEFSMRYAKATDDFYVPELEDVRSQVGKPGAYTFEPVSPELAEQAREEIRAVYDQAFETYERLVEAGVARELARSVMPVGAYTEFFWTINARVAHELHLAAGGRDGPARDPPLRGRLRGLLRGADAGYPCGVRGRGPRFPVSALHGVCKGFFRDSGVAR